VRRGMHGLQKWVLIELSVTPFSWVSHRRIGGSRKRSLWEHRGAVVARWMMVDSWIRKGSIWEHVVAWKSSFHSYHMSICIYWKSLNESATG
jgi:hypothetical protein